MHEFEGPGHSDAGPFTFILNSEFCILHSALYLSPISCLLGAMDSRSAGEVARPANRTAS